MNEAGFMSWLDLRCAGGDTLVCPVRTLWDDYRDFCTRWGFDQAVPGEFARLLGKLPGVRLVEGGRGRRRRCANGIGLRPMDDSEQEESHALND
jgi:hypothetical protein